MNGRLAIRLFRWASLAAAAPALWACASRTVDRPVLKQDQTFVKTFQQSINRNVDLLFMVDNSSSMKNSQDNLRQNFPTFMTRLQQPPGLPNIHVAVVSSDMGAYNPGDPTAIGKCSSSSSPGYAGNNGVFQYSVGPAAAGCTATGLDAGATFISDIGGVRNYTGNLEDVFSCIAALGENGCGFEHQFASVLRALGADDLGAPPAENQGFLRDDAYLVVVFITNEDDCSAPPGVALFDTTANLTLADQLGPITNGFRCNEFGHLCKTGGGAPMHPVRNAPGNDVTATVTYDSCTSNDTEGYLVSVADTARRLRAVKGDNADQVLVAAITGPATPYTVAWKPSAPTDTSCGAAACPWPVIGHSCGTDDTNHADPGIRVLQLVDEFHDNGLKLSICDDSFAPALDRIAALINQKLQPACITQTIANKPGTSDPDCTVVSHTKDSTGHTVDAPVPYCGSNGGAPPCWRLTASTDATTCAGQIVDVTTDPGASTATAQNATVNCSLVVE
jgi:hypothetical protein